MNRNFLAAWVFASIATAQPPAARDIADRITANNLKGDVSFLASDALQGRGTPSAGLDIAAEFIAAQFRAAGLEPAGDDAYFQTAPMLSVTGDTDGLQLTIDTGGKAITAANADVWIRQAAALDLRRAPAIVASSLDGLTPERVKGKALIFDVNARFIANNGAALARLEPALMVMLVNGAYGPPASRSVPQLRDASVAVTPMLVVWDPAVREALANAMPGPLEGTVSAHIASPKTVAMKLRNVVGVLRGSDPALRDTYVLLTAHYDHLGVRGSGPGDHIFNGANDDASGTASIIETARALASLGPPPKRSIIFVALFGEELGLLGSRYYARHPLFPLSKTVADLNLEHMGRTDVTGGPRVGILNATGFDYTDMTPVLAKAGEEFGIDVQNDAQNSEAFFGRSDNQAFAEAGVPSHTLSVGYIFPDYHQPGDEWPKLDYENMAKVDRAVALGVYRIADRAEPPRWNTENRRTEPYRKPR